MSKKKPTEENCQTPEPENVGQTEAPAQSDAPVEAAPQPELIEKDAYLRLAAEYDNFRRRTQKEKESTWNDAKAVTIKELLPVYDNLERALKQPCTDEAFKKGVEMTLTQTLEIFKKLGLEEIPAEGQPFDAALHNAVMHGEDETLGESVVSECFQRGFKLGDKVIRFAMVKVVN